ncbi:unnamed protein product [Brassica napus]|uniref:(rape) hypothetical protein n=1 Tax=Brassica napus TaxID=3708 RepID=A0A816J3A0_BRANA|nr:unnamed protein product [Brassica napus]
MQILGKPIIQVPHWLLFFHHLRLYYGAVRLVAAGTGGSGSVNIRRQLLFVSLPQTAASDAASERRVLRLTPIKPASGKVTQLHLSISLSISIPRTSEDLESSLHLKLSLHLELPPSQPLSPSRALSISGSLSVTSCIHLRLSGSPSVTICLHLGLSLFSEENPSPISSPSSLTHLRSHLEALLPISDLISKLSLLRAHLISKLSLLLFSLRGLAVTPFLYLHGSIAGLLRSSQAHSLKLRPSQTHSLLLFLSLFKMSTSKDVMSRIRKALRKEIDNMDMFEAEFGGVVVLWSRRLECSTWRSKLEFESWWRYC